jgi:hypothetical protein
MGLFSRFLSPALPCTAELQGLSRAIANATAADGGLLTWGTLQLFRPPGWRDTRFRMRSVAGTNHGENIA